MVIPIPSPVPVPCDFYEELVDRAWRLLERIVEEARRLVDRIIRLLEWALPIVRDAVVRAIEQFVDQVNRFVTTLRDAFIAFTGNPARLFEVADLWTSGVGLPSLEVERDFDTLHAGDTWRGPAAEKYAAAAATQQDAVGEIKGMTDVLHTGLKDIANGLIQYWVAIVGAIVVAVAGLALAVVEAVTVVLAVPAIVTAIAVIAVCIGCLVAEITALVSLVTTTNATITEMDLMVSGSATFNGGAWPKATAEDFGDASVLDGDNSDWKIRF